jgi:hypothetical protein
MSPHDVTTLDILRILHSSIGVAKILVLPEVGKNKMSS